MASDRAPMEGVPTIQRDEQAWGLKDWISTHLWNDLVTLADDNGRDDLLDRMHKGGAQLSPSLRTIRDEWVAKNDAALQDMCQSEIGVCLSSELAQFILTQ